MTKQEIISALVEKHKTFAAFFDTLDKDQFENSVSNKWSPGEQLEHILLSVKPLEKGLSSAPKLVLKLSFGTSKNGSRSYQEVIDLYHDKLSKGAKATKKFIPKTIVESEKKKLQSELNNTVESLANTLQKFNNNELDSLRLPHPLLGKLTIREMLYFTMYHVGHHLAKTKENL